MNHSEAQQQMAAERYLLNELAPDARDAFEEHLFDCQECALDIRAGSVFVHEVKIQLPAIMASQIKSKRQESDGKPKFWLSLWRPAFAAPAFAALLLLVGYQNLVTFPALRQSASEPEIAPVAPLHSAARGATRPTFTVDRTHGIALPLDFSSQPGLAPAASYAFDLRDAQGKIVWTSTVAAPAQGTDSDQSYSLTIPGRMLQNGAYSVTITSISAQGVRTPIEEYNFETVVIN